ncbi:conserved hypothetical protein [Vibrio coralliirubri]|nr:conserved hypothetical protein [Vibrio coralliirubri]
MTQHKIIGIDLAKNIFFLFEINHKGKNLSRKNFNEVSYLATSPIKHPVLSPWKLVPAHTTGLVNSLSSVTKSYSTHPNM